MNLEGEGDASGVGARAGEVERLLDEVGDVLGAGSRGGGGHDEAQATRREQRLGFGAERLELGGDGADELRAVRLGEGGPVGLALAVQHVGPEVTHRAVVDGDELKAHLPRLGGGGEAHEELVRLLLLRGVLAVQRLDRRVYLLHRRHGEGRRREERKGSNDRDGTRRRGRSPGNTRGVATTLRGRDV